MKKSKNKVSKKTLLQITGLIIGITALYLSVRNIDVQTLGTALKSMNTLWLIPIVLGNFCVIGFKALRWKIMITLIKKVPFPKIYAILTMGFMINNILPARIGEAARIHILGKDVSISRLTTTATVISDWIVEWLSFLFLATPLMFIEDVPTWIRSGLLTTCAVTVVAYIVAAACSKKRFKNQYIIKLQEGIKPLLHIKTMVFGLFTSLLSWLMQGLLIYMTQIAFGIDLPIWGIVLVLVAVNLAIAIPSAPSYIGTFEFACVLAYSYLGVDKSLGLLLGATYHLVQIIPVTIVGGIIFLITQRGFWKQEKKLALEDSH